MSGLGPRSEWPSATAWREIGVKCTLVAVFGETIAKVAERAAESLDRGRGDLAALNLDVVDSYLSVLHRELLKADAALSILQRRQSESEDGHG